MHNQGSWSTEKAAVTIVAISLMLVSGAWAASEQVLASLGPGVTGWAPEAGVIFDGSGNLYGMTAAGGDYKACSSGCGVIFELMPSSSGWTQTVIHAFTGKDGAYPTATLIIDNAGNLYGTTQLGGARNLGVVFELTPNTGGGWTEKVLHSFSGGYDGETPRAGLIADPAGNFYGTTVLGGAHSEGAAFELMPISTGWKYRVLHSFGEKGKRPFGGLIFDTSGNLYGTTWGGGLVGSGVVFELKRNSGGEWREIVLHSFMGRKVASKDGRQPFVGLVFDGKGNLYGATDAGGTHHNGRGVIFELMPASNGKWTEKVLHYGELDGGYGYLSSLVFDAAGNLYGGASAGGRNYFGTIFRLEPTTSGFWRETVVHSFQCCGDGTSPTGALIWDSAGNLYGTTVGGGTYGYGTVFQVTP